LGIPEFTEMYQIESDFKANNKQFNKMIESVAAKQTKAGK